MFTNLPQQLQVAVGSSRRHFGNRFQANTATIKVHANIPGSVVRRTDGRSVNPVVVRGRRRALMATIFNDWLISQLGAPHCKLGRWPRLHESKCWQFCSVVRSTGPQPSVALAVKMTHCAAPHVITNERRKCRRIVSEQRQDDGKLSPRAGGRQPVSRWRRLISLNRSGPGAKGYPTGRCLQLFLVVMEMRKLRARIQLQRTSVRLIPTNNAARYAKLVAIKLYVHVLSAASRIREAQLAPWSPVISYVSPAILYKIVMNNKNEYVMLS